VHEPLEPGDFVEAIIDELKPLKSSRDAAAIEVRRAIEKTRQAIDWRRRVNSRHAIVAHANKLSKALAKVEALLTSAPEPLNAALTLRLQATVRTWPPSNLHTVILSGALRGMREVCSHATKGGYGDHPNIKIAAHACAHYAAELLEDCSSEGRPRTGANTQFHRIVCLLYEAVTGREPSGETGLVHACNDFARLTNLRPKKPRRP
jgi:hypothetical protein